MDDGVPVCLKDVHMWKHRRGQPGELFEGVVDGFAAEGRDEEVVDTVCLIAVVPFLDEKFLSRDGLDRKLFAEFPDECAGRGLTRFDLPSWKLPLERIADTTSALTGEDGVVPDENTD